MNSCETNSGSLPDLTELDSTELSVPNYRRAGVFVLRRLVNEARLDGLLEEWRGLAAGRSNGAREVNPFNPVVVNEALPAPLAAVHALPEILDVMEQVYSDLGLYTQRFVIKDAQSRGPVFLHQDFGYDHGWPEKTSLFLALSEAGERNGGLVLHPGTHVLGYLGDTGEIDAAAFGDSWPSFCPSLNPGDAVLMHECLWHASYPYRSGPDRILVQITYQPASDPSTCLVLRGTRGTPHELPEELRQRAFKRSRASRLRELQAEVEQLRTTRAHSD